MPDNHLSSQFEYLIREAVYEPDACPEFVGHLRSELANMHPRSKPRLAFQPAWAMGFALLLLVVALSTPGVAKALKQWFGFVPGIGLVEQSEHLRILQNPVSVTREGITLTVEQVVANKNSVELAYSVSGIPAGMLRAKADQSASQELYCSGADMYPSLQLADGTVLVSDPMPLGGRWRTDGYVAGHSFSSPIPDKDIEVTFLLTCLQDVRREVGPEDWAISFTLVTAPADYVVGEPVYEVDPTTVTQPVNSGITFEVEGAIRQEDGVHIFFNFTSADDPSTYLALRPARMFIIDSTGTMIELINVLPWSPFDQVARWEYRSVAMPADGPLTIVIEGAQMYYLAQHLKFEFTPGNQPRLGQTWDLGHEFETNGYRFSVASARMIELDGHPGFEFSILSDTEAVKLSAELMDMTPSGMWSTTGNPQPAHSITTGFVYESTIPETVRVTFNTISVQIDGTWQAGWTAPVK